MSKIGKLIADQPTFAATELQKKKKKKKHTSFVTEHNEHTFYHENS
jgi:hypothetical protein